MLCDGRTLVVQQWPKQAATWGLSASPRYDHIPMPPDGTPKISDFLTRLDRHHFDQEKSRHESIAERRRAAERFEEMVKTVVRPVLGELHRELHRRGHSLKMTSDHATCRIVIRTATRIPREGALVLERSTRDKDKVRFTYDALGVKTDFGLPKELPVGDIGRDAVTRAVLRLVRELLADA